MRQIEDSWKINPRNPPNQFEVLENIHSKTVLSSEDHHELNNYKSNLFKKLINKNCSSICIGSKEIQFKNCFDNCEAKLVLVGELFNNSKKEYLEYKTTQSFAGKQYL